MTVKFQIIMMQSQQPDIKTLHVFSWQFRSHFTISWRLSSWLWILFFSLPCSTQRKEKESESHSVVSNSLWPHGLYSPWNGDLPYPGIEPRPPALQMDSLLAERPGKPKNTRMASLFLLHGIFLTQGLNQASLALQADSLLAELSGKPLYAEKNLPTWRSSWLV